MIATTDLEHDGHRYVAGECFQCAPIHAAALKYQRVAEFASKAQLKTRDLKAADASAEQGQQDQPTRRHYRRRDLTAEP